MIFYIFVILIVFCLMYRGVHKTEDIIILSVVASVFFFASADPFIGIPLYFYCMLISVLLVLGTRSVINRKAFTWLLLSVMVLLVPLITLKLGLRTTEFLLIKRSNTDLLDLTSQMMLPQLDFTVIKHFIFFVIYLFFIVLNKNVFYEREFKNRFITTIEKAFIVLFLAIIVEFILVNLNNGYNDRNLMVSLFSIKEANQRTNWITNGVYTVAFCFNERSSMAVSIIYYLIILNKNKLKTLNLVQLMLSYVAVFCTGSSSALGIAVIFLGLIYAKALIRKNYLSRKAIIAFNIIVAIIVSGCIWNYKLLFVKIISYLEHEERWGSAYFRSNSNIYGFRAFITAPLFGIGIGTVYCHSMLIQTLSNIGILGIFTTMAVHLKSIGIRFSYHFCINIISFIVISSSAFMVQQYTSPMLLAVILCAAFTDEEIQGTSKINFTKRKCIISFGRACLSTGMHLKH